MLFLRIFENFLKKLATDRPQKEESGGKELLKQGAATTRTRAASHKTS
jgi:hypothetical protein